MSKSNHYKKQMRWKIDKREIAKNLKRHLSLRISEHPSDVSERHNYYNIVKVILQYLQQMWIHTQDQYHGSNTKRIYYLSMEYLIGQLLDNVLTNLDLRKVVIDVLEERGIDYEKIRLVEPDAGLGNGGLGRLAACFLDSMATMGIPSIGYGILYRYGVFTQKIENGFQVEFPNRWLDHGNLWGTQHQVQVFNVRYYGHVDSMVDENDALRFTWKDSEQVGAAAHDILVPGYRSNIVNHLRLWRAFSSQEMNLKSFNQGEYIEAVRHKLMAQNISSVLYPNDKVFYGQELRLKQEYFLVSASLQDIIRRFRIDNNDWNTFPDKVVIQCNDTHPNLAIPELMRVLVDEEHIGWAKSWEITKAVFAYTNHTLMPEALEKWPVHLVRSVIPRHVQIIEEIDRRFLQEAMEFYGKDDPTGKEHANSQQKIAQSMGIIQHHHEPVINMAHLGIVGSFKVNGVAKLHSRLLKEDVFKPFVKMYPNRFINITNGITPRRWLLQCNPQLASLVTDYIGKGWINDLKQLKKLEQYIENDEFSHRFTEIKNRNKSNLARFIYDKHKIMIYRDSFLSIQIKRIHEYKRQLLALLYVVHRYNAIKANPDANWYPRTIIFSGKAAPGYAMAKLHIKLIHDVAHKVNHDPDVKGRLVCLFLSDYNVSLAERLIPVGDLSEQISTCGMEASGTGNMKFILNGCVIIGTMDGANVEIAESVGQENMFIFGLRVNEIKKMRQNGYNPHDFYEQFPSLRQIIDQISNGFFNPSQPSLYQPIIESLLHQGDYFFVLADFPAYVEAQEKALRAFQNKSHWAKMSMYNVARCGRFSSDYTILNYSQKIWGIPPLSQAFRN